MQGSLDGNPFVPQSAIFDVAKGETALVITSVPDFCEFARTSWSVDFPLPRSSEGLLVELNVPVQKTGNIVLLGGEAQFIVTGPQCQVGGTSIDGSFTFDVATADELGGTFDVDVHGTTSTVKFEAVPCDALLMSAPQKGECH